MVGLGAAAVRGGLGGGARVIQGSAGQCRAVVVRGATSQDRRWLEMNSSEASKTRTKWCSSFPWCRGVGGAVVERGVAGREAWGVERGALGRGRGACGEGGRRARRGEAGRYRCMHMHVHMQVACACAALCGGVPSRSQSRCRARTPSVEDGRISPREMAAGGGRRLYLVRVRVGVGVGVRVRVNEVRVCGLRRAALVRRADW